MLKSHINPDSVGCARVLPRVGKLGCHSPKQQPADLMNTIATRSLVRVLKILGIERSGHAHDKSQGEARTLSRRGFGQIAAGVAATVGIFATGTFAGVRPASAAESPVKSVSYASRPKVAELISDALKSEDFLSIADSEDVELVKSSSPQAVDELTESQFQLSTSGALSTYSSSMPVAQAAMKNMKDGRVVDTLTVTIEDAKVMYVINFNKDGPETEIRAERYVVDVGADRLEIVDSSSNGIRMEPVPDGVSPHASDPCGGCTSATHQALASICKTTAPVDCVLSGVGCAGCVAGCTKINLNCIGCVATTCGAALIKCCNKQEGGACFPCGVKP